MLQLLTNYGLNADATFLLDNYHFVIIPVANPDGYEYSRAHPDNVSHALYLFSRLIVNHAIHPPPCYCSVTEIGFPT